MSSTQRSSSSVRSLRAVFENPNSSESISPLRGRSPAGSVAGSSTTDRSPASSLATRKVRSSFVSVEPVGQLDGHRGRRTSLSQMESAADSSGYGQSDGTSSQPPPFQEAAVPTPLVRLANPSDVNEASKEMTLPTREIESDHPEKSVSAVVDEDDADAELRPGDVTDTAAVSQGAAVSDQVEELPPADPSKPSVASSRSTGGVKSAVTRLSTPNRTSDVQASTKTKTAAKPAAKPTSKTSSTLAKTGPRSPTRPGQVSSHLTQPTAASAAKHEPDPPVQTKQGPTSASHKPISVSSHLMQPTAASKARQEAETSPTSPQAPKIPSKPSAPKPNRSSLAGATKSTQPASSTKKSTGAGRLSLASSTNGISRQNNAPAPVTKAAAQPPSGDFLARMTKPTAASSSRLHEKPESKSPPPTKPSNSSAKRESMTQPLKSNAPKNAAVSSPSMPKPKTSGAAKQSFDTSASKTKPSNRAPVGSVPADSPGQIVDLPSAEPSAVVADAGHPAALASNVDGVSAVENLIASDIAPLSRNQAEDPASTNEWNPASLPDTPQTKADLSIEDVPQSTAKSAVTPEDKTGRRSMMDTPELESATIH